MRSQPQLAGICNSTWSTYYQLREKQAKQRREKDGYRFHIGSFQPTHIWHFPSEILLLKRLAAIEFFQSGK